MKKKDNRKFANGLCFKKLFIIFLIGSIFGAIYEELLAFVKTYIEYKEFVWVYRRGVIYGPFSPIYGIGAVLMIWFLTRKKHKELVTLLYGSLIGGAFEYGISFLQEKFLRTSSWDYSGQFLDINGRTTIPIMLAWGILTVVLIHYIYPWICNKIEKIPIRIGNIVTNALIILMSANIFISWTALIRQTMRRNNIPPYTPLGELYDAVYTDKFLAKYFENMVPTK